MKTELSYLTYVAVFAALLWVPYILGRIATRVPDARLHVRRLE